MKNLLWIVVVMMCTIASAGLVAEEFQKATITGPYGGQEITTYTDIGSRILEATEENVSVNAIYAIHAITSNHLPVVISIRNEGTKNESIMAEDVRIQKLKMSVDYQYNVGWTYINIRRIASREKWNGSRVLSPPVTTILVVYRNNGVMNQSACTFNFE